MNPLKISNTIRYIVNSITYFGRQRSLKESYLYFIPFLSLKGAGRYDYIGLNFYYEDPTVGLCSMNFLTQTSFSDLIFIIDNCYVLSILCLQVTWVQRVTSIKSGRRQRDSYFPCRWRKFICDHTHSSEDFVLILHRTICLSME